MSALVSQLLSALAAGTVEKFRDLPEGQIDALREEFLGTFAAEQGAVLKSLVLSVAGHEAEVYALNAASPLHKLGVVRLADGTPVLPVSLLTWTRPGEGFAPAYDFLLSLKVRQVTADDWPEGEAL